MSAVKVAWWKALSSVGPRAKACGCLGTEPIGLRNGDPVLKVRACLLLSAQVRGDVARARAVIVGRACAVSLGEVLPW